MCIKMERDNYGFNVSNTFYEGVVKLYIYIVKVAFYFLAYMV